MTTITFQRVAHTSVQVTAHDRDSDSLNITNTASILHHRFQVHFSSSRGYGYRIIAARVTLRTSLLLTATCYHNAQLGRIIQTENFIARSTDERSDI